MTPEVARILVVDDDPGILRILRGYLEQAGFEVREARGGLGAGEADRLLAEIDDPPQAASSSDASSSVAMSPAVSGVNGTVIKRTSACGRKLRSLSGPCTSAIPSL